MSTKVFSHNNTLLKQLSDIRGRLSMDNDICLYDCEYGDASVISSPCIAIVHSETESLPQGTIYMLLYPFSDATLLKAMNRIAERDSATGNFGMRKNIKCLFAWLGMPQALRGTKYLVDAVFFKINCKNNDISMKRILGRIADKYSVTANSVERNIRTAVEHLFICGDADKIYRLFGATVDSDKGKTTNYQFISVIAEKCMYNDYTREF